MDPELNYCKFMQNLLDYPRWLPGAVTKDCKTMKMTVSQKSLIEIEPTLCQNVFCMKLF